MTRELRHRNTRGETRARGSRRNFDQFGGHAELSARLSHGCTSMWGTSRHTCHLVVFVPKSLFGSFLVVSLNNRFTLINFTLSCFFL